METICRECGSYMVFDREDGYYKCVVEGCPNQQTLKCDEVGNDEFEMSILMAWEYREDFSQYMDSQY